MKNSLEFVGFKEVEKALTAMQEILPPAKLDAILRKSAKPYLDQARENASHHDVRRNKDTGKSDGLSKSIGAEKARSIGKSVGINLGPRRGRGFKGYHAHLLEFGTGPRKLTKPRKRKIGDKWAVITHTGTMPATPFLRPAWDQKQGEVLNAIKTNLGNEITGGFNTLIK